MIPIWEGMLDSGTGSSRLPCLMVLPMYTRSSCRGVLHVREAFSDGLVLCGARSLSRVQLCDPTDCSPPRSSVHGILQARTLEWVPFPSPGDLPDPGMELVSPASPALAGSSLPPVPPGKSCVCIYVYICMYMHHHWLDTSYLLDTACINLLRCEESSPVSVDWGPIFSG